MTNQSLLHVCAGLATVMLSFTISTQASNSHYPDNRAPLLEKPFTALPLGSVTAKGWLLKQLELQRDGLTGNAEEAIPEIDAKSGWLGGPAEKWEKGPYYLKGLIPLAYTLDDATLKQRAQKWIDWSLQSKRADGFYGPRDNDDWWPRMVMNYALRDYEEATGDPRVIPFLTRYYRYMAGELEKRPLQDWGRARAGDEMDTIFWLYNRTGDAFLLPLADLLKKQAYDWVGILSENRFQDFGKDFHPKHNVNIPQALKLPGVYWQRSGRAEDRQAIYAGYRHLMRDHGLSFGLNSGTEFLSGNSSSQGAEFCTIVEKMLSDETNLRITGDAMLGDQLEEMAFNALPGAWTKDLRAFQYYTLPNEVIAKRSGNGFFQDYDDALLPGPHSGCHCCCYNVHMGWPKYVQSCWAATSDNGLAALAYAPTEVRAKVGNGSMVKLTEETDYPFGDQVRIKVTLDKETEFPLKLRLPGWCAVPVARVNGKATKNVGKAGSFLTIDRKWKTGDVVTLELPMFVRVGSGINRSAHVNYGPLLFSLQIKEEWTVVTKGPRDFNEFEVTPKSDWNYGLVFDPRKAGDSFKVDRKGINETPFSRKDPSIRITAQARKLPDWGLAWSGDMAFDPPLSPVASTEPMEKIILVPFGAQTLRVTDFPTIGSPAPFAKSFRDDFENGSIPDWVTYGGGWHVKQGKLLIVPSAGGGARPGYKAVATATRFKDFVYEADVATGPVGNAGMIFRVSKPSVGADAYLGYYAGIDAVAGRVELGRADGRSFKSLGIASARVVANQMTHLKVIANGSEIQLFVGDSATPLITATDATYSAGAIGVRQYCTDMDRTEAAFDNVRVQTSP